MVCHNLAIKHVSGFSDTVALWEVVGAKPNLGCRLLASLGSGESFGRAKTVIFVSTKLDSIDVRAVKKRPPVTPWIHSIPFWNHRAAPTHQSIGRAAAELLKSTLTQTLCDTELAMGVGLPAEPTLTHCESPSSISPRKGSALVVFRNVSVRKTQSANDAYPYDD